jgi:hypothetical protein
MNDLKYVNYLHGIKNGKVLIETHDEHECGYIWVQGYITHIDDDFTDDEDDNYCLSLETHLLGTQYFYQGDILNIEEFGIYKKVPKNKGISN